MKQLISWVFIGLCAVFGQVQGAQEVEWDNLSFAVTPTDAMYRAECQLGEKWQVGALVPYGPLEISPGSCILNYGQGIFEGMKAYRTQEGRIVLFRPEENARRFQNGAIRMGMPPVSEEMFLNAVKQTILANKDWIPPAGKGALYIRPLLLGTGVNITLTPAPSFTFLIFVTPVGDYFKGGIRAINLLISQEFHRAHPGGSGDVKASGNYAANFVPLKEAKAKGYAELIYLDVTSRYIEEVGAANFFCVKDDVLYTPELTGTILPGITRDSIMKLAASLGYQVKEKKIDVDFCLSADEAFCCGTAAVISPVGSITYGERKVVFNNGAVGTVTLKLYEALTGIQNERSEDTFGWVHVVQ